MTKDSLRFRRFQMRDYLVIPMRFAPVWYGLKILRCLLGALLPVLSAKATGAFVDTMIAIYHNDVSQSAIYAPMLCIALLIAFSYLQWQLMNFVNLRLVQKMERDYRCAFVEKRASLQYAHVENNNTWELVTRVCSDPVGQLGYGFGTLLDGVEIIISTLSLFLVIAAEAWWAALLALVVSVPLVVIGMKYGKKTYEANTKAQQYERRAGYYHAILQGRDAAQERALFEFGDKLDADWLNQAAQAQNERQRNIRQFFARSRVGAALPLLQAAATMIVLLFPLKEGTLSVGSYIGLTTAIFSVFSDLSYRLIAFGRDWETVRIHLRDIEAFFLLEESEGALELPCVDDEPFGGLEFRNVSFQYPGCEQYVLRHLSMTLQPGKSYALVGKNGAGKTTIIKLLDGLYDTYEGEILWNGVEWRSIPLPVRKAYLGIAYQDFLQYHISMRENIQLGNLNVPEMDAEVGAVQMNLQSVIDKLENEMDTPLGKVLPGSVDLSGGEWQRVALARVLSSPAPLLVLDEPTSALDPVAESDLYQMFQDVIQHRTSLIITHRLGAARIVDEILVIDNGTVIEQGNHEELMQVAGIYAEMFELQRSWYE